MTFALCIAAVLGLTFASTRWLGVLCSYLLAVRYPVPFFVLLLIVAGVYLYVHQRRD